MIEWKPIETAPLDRPVLLWWVGGTKLPKAPPTCTIGAVSSHEQDMVWIDRDYHPTRFYTHWAPLPDGPVLDGEIRDGK